MSFEPIAIVGQGCVLPGALRPEELWANVRAGRDQLSSVPDGYWGLDAAKVLVRPEQWTPDKVWSDRGGYVRGFAPVFDPEGFTCPSRDILALDEQFHWVLHVARAALTTVRSPRERAGLVLGNLAYPTFAFARYAESVWLNKQHPPTHPLNRFHAGMIAHFTAQALGMGAGAFALDAACASSLYAIKLACDRLHDRRADVMLAGAVNRCDDLLIHAGFCSLGAMSKTGQSRPFHQGADGLVPAEGAALVALKRLDDAVADNDEILGVIRGIGLSNDGRHGGLLTPSARGQIRAMRQAYRCAALDPASISLVECHATGTSVGDAVEAQSLGEVFADAHDLPIGSLKSNLGHLITAAGAAGLLKVLGAFRAGVRPPTLHAEVVRDELKRRPLRILQQAEEWSSRGPRRAAVSAFGFGGANAHLIVEEWQQATRFVPCRASRPHGKIAVVRVAVRVGELDTEGFATRLFQGSPTGASSFRSEEVLLDARTVNFPPRDLERTLAQQLMLLEVALQATKEVQLPSETTAVYVGMQCDGESPRCVARIRLGEQLDAYRNQIVQQLEAAAVVGAMPNIPANRINSQLDLGGPSFTVAAEELSGLRALEVARRALASGEIDAAIVGAVDLCCEPVHARAAAAVLPATRGEPGDAAVVLVLKRLADAERDQDTVLAVLDDEATSSNSMRLQLDAQASGLSDQFGHAHAASGLLLVAAATLAVSRRLRPTANNGPMIWIDEMRHAEVSVTALGGQSMTVGVSAVKQNTSRFVGCPFAIPELVVYSGADRAAVLRALEQDERGADGPARLVLVASEIQTLAQLKARARETLTSDGDVADAAAGIFYRDQPLAGKVAFMGGSASTTYSGMSAGLLWAFPELFESLFASVENAVPEASRWWNPDATGKANVFDKLAGSMALTTAHGLFTRDVLGIQPDVAFGLSSGEKDVLFAAGLCDWHQLGDHLQAVRDTGLLTKELSGDFAAARRAWQLPPGEPVNWSMWRTMAPVEQVRAALEGEERVHLGIVHAPGDVLLVGARDACRRVLARLGHPTALEVTDYTLVFHAPELRHADEAMRRSHVLPIVANPGIKYHTALATDLPLTPESFLTTYLAQATGFVDFPRLVERVWDAGVRIFVEHGPHNLCSRWVSQTLHDREHLTVALDVRGNNGLLAVAHTLATLLVAGVRLDYQAFNARMQLLRVGRVSPAAPPTHPLRFPAHLPTINIPAKPTPAALQPAVSQEIPVVPMTNQANELVTPRPAATTTGKRRLVQHAVETQQFVFQNFLHHQRRTFQNYLDLRDAVVGRLASFATATVADAVPTTVKHEPPTRSLPSVPHDVQVPAPSVKPTPTVVLPRGPSFDREQLLVMGRGKISTVFGPLFEQQDDYTRQVRLPAPPLLLVDRITGIDAEAGVHSTGTIWTETDIRWDSWYLHHGVMPAGIMIEAGQADLTLISWMGADFKNRDERVYRLLGCDLTYHGGLPQPGDTLCYDIHIDGHAKQNDIRLFFFHYDGRIDGERRISVRNGQAGFFTEQELNDSGGIIWSAEGGEHSTTARLDAPRIASKRAAFSADELTAYYEGNLADCFGPGYELLHTHTRSPRNGKPELRLLHEITHCDARGGPWGRGYLRARTEITPHDWFFEGHFHNDPCMPGTLMFEGTLQAMAFYLTWLGFTLNKDGWRFEPVPDEVFKLRCRGQTTPASRELVCELFIEEVHDGPQPTLYADLLGTVDGLKAFHCRRMGLRLVPDWPLSSQPELLATASDTRPFAIVDDVRGDFPALLACAWGRPSDAFGSMYQVFDGHRRAPRLPGPPYHFMSRITRMEAERLTPRIGATVEVEYDVPADAWYFDEQCGRAMPFCVLMEVNLQPCGWLATFLGFALQANEDLSFRNLDGTGTVASAVRPTSGTLRTRATLTKFSTFGGMVIVFFETECWCGTQFVCRFETSFGFFTDDALGKQVGLPPTASEREALDAPSHFACVLSELPPAYFGSELRLPSERLRMLDDVTGYWPTGGKAGLGRLRSEQSVNPAAWYFKAHFYQDPVQAGSLGVEAMLQLLQFYVLERKLHANMAQPIFEPIATGCALTWKYRGQVGALNQRVRIILDIVDVQCADTEVLVVAEAWLWVDELRIYHAQGLAVRVRSAHAE